LNTFTFTVHEKNAEATGSKLGIDCLVLGPAR
jgi:hypothetical protein